MSVTEEETGEDSDDNEEVGETDENRDDGKMSPKPSNHSGSSSSASQTEQNSKDSNENAGKESNDDAKEASNQNAEEDSDKNAGEESNDDAKEASDTNTFASPFEEEALLVILLVCLSLPVGPDFAPDSPLPASPAVGLDFTSLFAGPEPALSDDVGLSSYPGNPAQ